MVLPRRYEQATEYQEKLRQLYHTKLEQLTNLSNRLNTLANSLDPGFYSHDILHPTPAPGQEDESSNRDVTPERFSKLEKELVRGKSEVLKRLNQLSELFVQIDWLYTELGITPPSLEDLDSSSSSRSTSSLGLHPPSDPFIIATPTPPSRSSKSNSPLLFSDDDDVSSPPSSTTKTSSSSSDLAHQRVFATFLARVEEAETEGHQATQNPNSPPLGLSSVSPTPALLSWASSLCASLEETKRRRESHIQAMYDQLEPLWQRLKVDPEDMDAFVNVNRGSTEECVRAYEEELERMLELKRERMGEFIQSAREQILRLWDELMTGEEERGAFGAFVDDEHTEELFGIHEEEIRKLQEEKRLKAPLLASVRKYFEICDEERELAAAATDQTRLTGRGSRDPGRLLREEKMRKRVQKEKPRLEQDLLASIPIWEQETNRPFLVHGESMLQLLMETVSAADKENSKRNAGKPRAGSVPPRATTPTGYAPAPGKAVVTPAVRSAPQHSQANSAPPNKRMKFNDESHSSGRAPLGAHRGTGVNGGGASSVLGNSKRRDVSPSKIPGSGIVRSQSSLSSSTLSNVPSSLPRPTPIPISMPIPKPGTQHHALGHGRVPTSGVFTSAFGSSTSNSHHHGSGGFPVGIRTASTTRGYPTTAGGRIPSGSGSDSRRKASRTRRESFKPRPSMENLDVPVGPTTGGRWPHHSHHQTFVGLKEEDED
ncbi:Microtubule bundling protein [Stygiomarasmius scandens]|uniref:Microtubule bundling protein n=1 Tax=Marasmiellus scandens TaxID=2682957 RepID=A0ABR1JDV9_9AGAR